MAIETVLCCGRETFEEVKTKSGGRRRTGIVCGFCRRVWRRSEVIRVGARKLAFWQRVGHAGPVG